MTLSTRIGVMRAGCIEQVGEPREIYEFPTNRFVADFVGSVNMFEGIVIEDEPDYVRIRSEEAATDIFVSHGVSCSPNQKMWYALRPEKLNIARTRPDQKDNVVEGVVEDIAYMGDQSIYRVRLKSGKIVRLTRTNRDRGEEAPITWDETVYLSWVPSAGVVLAS